MNLWAVLGAGLLAGLTTCAVTQGALLVALLARQRRQAGESPRTGVVDDLVPVTGFLVGKLLSLTLLGAALGAVGAMIDLDARLGGLAQLAAGIVMIVLALGTLGVPGFRDIVITPPASWLRAARRSTRSSSAAAPFMLGLAMVLVPCGVTVSMLLLAAASGSPQAGAATMAVFVIGSAPPFLLMGALTQRFAGAGTGRPVVRVALGVVVVALGLVTMNAGLVVIGAPVTAQTVASSLTGGTPDPTASATTQAAQPGKAATQVITIDALEDGFSPSTISAKAGMETTLVLRTQDTYSCILWFVVPSRDISAHLPVTGETRVELGRLDPGDLTISCSMGMYTGTIVAA